MPSYSYPVARPEGTLTTAQIHLLLSNPRIISKRIARLSDNRFLADYLLTGRYSATGGGIFYENGDPIFAADDPEAIAPGGEYPLTVMSRGDLEAAKTVKWGRDAEIYDEAISRLGIDPLNRGLLRLVNSMVRYIDTVAWGVINTKVTAQKAASAAWATTGAIITDLLAARAADQDLEMGIDRDTVVLTTVQYAKIMGTFLNAGVLPREGGNPIVNGSLPTNLLGFNWVTSTHIVGTDPLLIDRTQLGGMADEDLGSPGYVRNANLGVETLSDRIVGRDGYRIRSRRVTVPVVIEPAAGIRITGTGL